MDEVTLPKFNHLDSWFITISYLKIVFVLALATIKSKPLFFKMLESRKIMFISFVACVLLGRWEVETDIFSCIILRNVKFLDQVG